MLLEVISSRLTKASTKEIPGLDLKQRKDHHPLSIRSSKSNDKFAIVPRSKNVASSASVMMIIISWVSDGNFQQNPLLAVRTEWKDGPAASRPWTFLWLVLFITQRKAIQLVIMMRV
jgi:hypothetical protein